jgi:hypothetical protein
MPGAPVGAIVRITYDANDEGAIGAGDFLATAAGRFYEVLAARRQRSKYLNRWLLELLVIEAIPAGRDPLAIVHPLVFNRRG